MKRPEGEQRFPLNLQEFSTALEGPSTMEAVLKTLDEQRLGRAITLVKDLQYDKTLGPQKTELAGYILPLNARQTEHLIFLSSGIVMVVKPKDESNEQRYKFMCSPSNQCIYGMPDNGYWSVNGWEFDFTGFSSTLGSIEVMRNDRAENIEKMKGHIDKALSVAYTLREERLRSQEESVNHIVYRINEGFVPLEDHDLAINTPVTEVSKTKEKIPSMQDMAKKDKKLDKLLNGRKKKKKKIKRR